MDKDMQEALLINMDFLIACLKHPANWVMCRTYRPKYFKFMREYMEEGIHA